MAEGRSCVVSDDLVLEVTESHFHCILPVKAVIDCPD